MFVGWIFLMGVIAASDAFLLAGMTATIKTYSEHFPWLISGRNSTYHDEESNSSRSDNTEKPTTLKEYLQEFPTDHNANHQNFSSGTWADSKVVIVARIGDFENDTGGEWVVIAEPKERTESLNDNKKSNTGNSTESSDYFLGNDDIQQYFNDYQDLLYTFKDFVKIGANPSLRTNISQYNPSSENIEKSFNVTYVMPIPKTKKYFEIKLSNLTNLQYNEINALLQKHILKKTNSKETTKSREQDIVYVDENTRGNNLISHALSNQSSLANQTSKPILYKNRFTKDLPKENEPISDYFGPLLTPEGFNYFLNNFDSIHINLNNKSVDQTLFQPNSFPPMIQNNGFHAEIATDYFKRNDEVDENNTKEDSYSQTHHDYKDLFGPNHEQVGIDESIFVPRPRRNRTKLFLQTRSKRPIMNAPDNVLNDRQRLTSPTTELPITTDSSSLLSNSSNKTITPNYSSINITSNLTIDKPFKITSQSTTKNISTDKDNKIPETNTTSTYQDWLDMQKLFNSSSATAHKISKPFHIMEAAEWLLDTKRKIEEEERKKIERFKNYIKQFLAGDEGSILQGKENDGNIMKINKQENILEELKFLMLDYFASLNFKTHDAIGGNTSSAIESILNATNIFELMEQSSQLVKLNLHMKLQSENQEPSKFVKQIVEKQVEKCKNIFNKGLVLAGKQNPPGSTKKSGHRRFMVFTKCMNFKLKRCIKGFSLWLEKGKFFLRPQFKLDRAYENYEIERNLYCLRNYNPSSLSSNRHGVRVKPGLKINRKLGPRKIGARQNKLRSGIRANKENRQLNRKPARSNIENNRRYKQQRISKQRSNTQRYSEQLRKDANMRQN